MNNLDDFLNSMGITSTEDTHTTQEPEPQVVQVVVEDPEPEVQSLTQDDFDDILSGMGFVETTDNNESIEEDVDEEATEEEIINTHSVQLEEAIEEYNENLGEAGVATQEYRDLDAEEDADWERAIEDRVIVPSENGNHRVVNSESSTEESEVTAEENQREPLLQPNSPTLLMDFSTSRFSGTEWYNEIQKQRVIIAGIGGIGSNVAFQLARMCPASMVMYDDDTVETVNMSGQLFGIHDVGKSKVDAMVDMITKYTSMRNIYAARQKYDSSCEAGDIMICGFDNMSARRTFFGSWCNHLTNKTPEEKKKCLFLDGRLSIDTLQVFAFTGDDGYNILRYQDEYLFSDADADETVCSMKQTTYLACMIGSIMVNLFTNFTANLLDPIIPYDLPFFTEYDAQNMIFKTIK